MKIISMNQPSTKHHVSLDYDRSAYAAFTLFEDFILSIAAVANWEIHTHTWKADPPWLG